VTPKICGGCRRELEVGDRYIEDSPAGYLGNDVSPEIDGLVADILSGDATLSGRSGGKVVYCEDCTEPGGHYTFQTYGEAA